MKDWIYKGKPFTIDDMPNEEEAIGFVYLMEYKGKKYIGRKVFWNKTKTKISKKEIKLTSTRKRIRRGYKVSDWVTYYSSNKELNSAPDKDNIERTILMFCETLPLCKYYEAKEQFSRDVLLDDSYLNGNIRYSSFKLKS